LALIRESFVKTIFSTALCAVALAIAGNIPVSYGQTTTKLGLVPQFLKSVSYPVPGVTNAVLVDVNGDGVLDIVTANGFSGNEFIKGGQGVSVLLGNGDGTFQAAHLVLAKGNPTSIVAGDFDGDGKPDIVISFGAGVSSLSILHGNGDGTFQAPSNIPVGFFAGVDPANVVGTTSLVAADFTNDGKLDLAVAGSVVTTNAVTGGSPFAVYSVEVLVNRGDGSFSAVDTAAPLVSEPVPLVVADFDGDGQQDLISSDTTVLLGNGDGSFRTIPSADGGVFRAYGAVGDFNGDGRLDIAGMISQASAGHLLPPPQSVIWFGAPGGTFTDFVASNFISSIETITNNGLTFGLTFNGDNLVAADFNGDGKLDIAGFREVSYGAGTGQFNATFNPYDFVSSLHFEEIAGEFVPPELVTPGDLDRDGAPDLIAVGDGNSVQVALNTAGRAPKLAQMGIIDVANFPTSFEIAKDVVGGAAKTIIIGEVSLGAPAPAGGAVVTLVSSNPAVSFPGGNTVVIPAGTQFVDFKLTTKTVLFPTVATISATYHLVTLSASVTLVPAFTLASISPVTMLGEFGGNAGVGSLTLSGPAGDGVVVSLSSANPAVLTVPASVVVAPGATTATFPMTANHVSANTAITVTGSLAGTIRSGAVTVQSQPGIVVVQKAEYVVKKGQLTVQATSTNIGAVGSAAVPQLEVFNAGTGALIGIVRLANVAKGNIGLFTGTLNVTGPLTSIGVQDFSGGLAIAAAAQK
jgi:FG-GAP-like repeat